MVRLLFPDEGRTAAQEQQDRGWKAAMKSELLLLAPDDMHVHLRDDAMLLAVAPLTAEHFQRALVMPNLLPPVLTAQDAIAYKGRIKEAVGSTSFEPLMTIKITDTT